jgi:hypothetical protein
VNEQSEFHGITHARGFSRLTYWLWRKLKCERSGVHLLDEVRSPGGTDGWEHYLSCDACGLMVEIARISTEYIGWSRIA